MTPRLQTGLTYHDAYLGHDTGVDSGYAEFIPGGVLDRLHLGIPHPENPARLRSTIRLLKEVGIFGACLPLPVRAATMDEVEMVHTPEYVQWLKEQCARAPVLIDPDTPVACDSFDTALLAAGGLLEAVDAVIVGTCPNALVLHRPPGHHALPDRGMGFCLLNNVALAARHLQREHGLERILIVDWDVHHGNGTQAVFFNDPSALFFSAHQEELYPVRSGLIDEVGGGPGYGYTINAPLPPGVGDSGYEALFSEVLLPVAEQYNPECILVSAGQDSHFMDILGRMCISANGYKRLTKMIFDLAARSASGRVVIILEGGYHPAALAFSVLKILEALCGEETGVDEPFRFQDPGVSQHCRDVISKVQAAHRDRWRF